MTVLEDFLQDGFKAVSPQRIGDIAADTRDRCYSTGDVRYCIAAECLDIIASCWGDDGAVRRSFVDQLEEFAMGDFRRALEEPDKETARQLTLGARSNLLTLVGEAGDLVYE